MGFWQCLRERLADRLLVLRVPVGVEQRDRHRLGPGLSDPVCELSCSFGRELFERAIRGHALGGAEAEILRRERRRPGGAQAVELRAILAPESDQVREPVGGHERGGGAAPLEQRVGRDRHPVRELLDLVRVRARLGERRLDRGEHALGLIVGGGRRLRGDHAPVEREYGIGECSTHVDADQHRANVTFAPEGPERFAPERFAPERPARPARTGPRAWPVLRAAGKTA